MMTPNWQLTLLSCAARSHCATFHETLRDLGFSVDLIPCPAGLGALLECGRRRIIFFFDRTNCLRERAQSILAEREIWPQLGIIDGSDPLWDPKILCCCNEFVVWPCRQEELALRLERANVCPRSKPFSTDKARLLGEFAGVDLIGKSDAFVEMIRFVKKIAPCDAPVLIEGETGTGKEMVARAFHYLGRRSDHPFVPVNCGAIPNSLIENELYGHKKGAFTDAESTQAGLVTQAHGGTLFLDEVENLSLKAQGSLLRFLQDYEYKPLGGKHVRKADVRTIAATNQNLNELVERGGFRQDLLFRLNTMTLRLPRLSERCDDIEMLAEHFIRRYCLKYERSTKMLHHSALYWMKSYDWPGNVRELESFIHRGVLLCDDAVIRVPHDAGQPLAAAFPAASESPYELKFSRAKARVVAEFEKRYLIGLMTQTHGNVTRAAKCAGKERRAFGKLLKKHRIDRLDYTSPDPASY